MQRTYKSKKETAGTIDPRDVLLTLDAKSSVFDAFYIQNIKQTKRDMSVASSMQFAASNKVRKRKNVKRLKEQEALFQPIESTSITAFLTPDKSFRVNRPQDLFDQLLNSSSNKVEPLKPVNMCRKPSAIQKKTYIKKKPKKIKIVNYSNSDSTDSDKENFKCIEEANKTANTSDIKSHKLIIEKETKSSPKYDESINDIVNNLSIFSNIKNQTFTTPKNNNNICTKQTQPLQTSPLCSTPFLHKYRGASIYRFSPISRSLDSSPKCVTVMEDSNDATDDLPIVHEEKNKMKSYIIDEKQDITEATINENIEQNIVPENKSDCNTFDIISKNNATTASIIYDTIHESNKTEIQSPILSNQVNVNKREPRKLATYLSCMQTTETEPFLGFEHIDLVENDKLDAIHNKYIELKNIMVENSIPTPTKISRDSTFVNNNLNIEKDQKAASSESEASSGVENSDSESFYDACNSDDDIEEQAQNIEPVVVVEKLNDSVFERYYSQMANYSVESNDLNSSSDSYDYASNRASALILANKSSNSSIKFRNSSTKSRNSSIKSRNSSTKSRNSSIKSRNSSIKSRNSSFKSRNSSFKSRNSDESTDFDISLGDVENNGNIISNQIDDNDNSIESKPEDICVSFVTTRRRNEFRNDSFIGLNNSIVSACSHEFDKTALTNKNSLEYSNYVTLEENIVDNIDDTLNIEEEIDQNETAYKCSISESDEISEAEHSPKVKKILTRKSVRESIKVNKSKSPINNANSSINIETEEIDQKGSAFKHSISRSDEINDGKHSPKSSKDKKSKSPLTNTDNSLNKVTRSSSIYRDSIAGKSQNSAGYGNNMGNDSISCEQPGIILEPGKRWERSLSIYRRQTMMADHFNHSILDEELGKVRKYRQSVITATEMEDLKGSFHNDSINSRRGTFVSKPSRSTIKIVRESNISRASLCSTIVGEDIEGFLGEDCDDTIVELSKLSIADSQHEVTIIEKFHDTSNRRTTARDYVLRRCNQADVLPFDECYPDPVLKNCRKIGEGVYGEVFLWRAGDGRARVLKVIPIAGNIKVNGEQQKDFHEIISEIVIAMELSALRAPIADIEQHLNEGKSLESLDLHSVENATDAFNEVLSVRCVCGRYPPRLLELWELYAECRGSENDNPGALPHEQQYVVLELGNAGQDLESYQFHNAQQAHALFRQIAFGLAVAEEAYQFEHRDLHWGNVLISPTEEKYASFVVRGRLHRVCRGGVRASIIDYSLSRATLGRWSLYNDLANDDALFDALGDYQFQLYRLMRDKLGNDWKNFEPYTNILWLHYTVDKMITALRYTRTNTKIHKHYIAKLKEIKNGILDYGSAVQYVLTDNEL